MQMIKWALATAASAVCMSQSAVAQTSIPYTDRKEVRGSEIYLGAEPNDEILVFPAGEFVLNGSDLNINAGKIELQGDLVIRAFAEDKVAPPKEGVAATGGTGGGGPKEGQGGGGRVGDTGAVGESGAHAGRIRLRFTQIIGPGKLIIINDGAGGGKGQKGGIGGQGGVGGPGHNRNCNIGNRDSPRNGGKGGTGGPGGQGGEGGAGGNGGSIVYLAKLKPFVDQGKLVLRAQPGAPGEGGDPGDPGRGGKGGKGGEGGSCGGGSDEGPGGDPGQPGKKGPTGKSGMAGIITETQF